LCLFSNKPANASARPDLKANMGGCLASPTIYLIRSRTADALIGLPSPEFLDPLVGSFEIARGRLVLLGLITRRAVIPLLTITAVAL